MMGGKPSKGTSKDKRLKENKPDADDKLQMGKKIKQSMPVKKVSK